MKSKMSSKKMNLHRETLRALDRGDLGKALGGMSLTCFESGCCTGSGGSWSQGTGWFGGGGGGTSCNG